MPLASRTVLKKFFMLIGVNGQIFHFHLEIVLFEVTILKHLNSKQPLMVKIKFMKLCLHYNRSLSHAVSVSL